MYLIKGSINLFDNFQKIGSNSPKCDSFEKRFMAGRFQNFEISSQINIYRPRNVR